MQITEVGRGTTEETGVAAASKMLGGGVASIQIVLLKETLDHRLRPVEGTCRQLDRSDLGQELTQKGETRRIMGPENVLIAAIHHI